MKKHVPPHRKLNELSPSQVSIKGGFWGPRLSMNAKDAIFYQWEKLEETGHIDNFRIVAGTKSGFRRGFFYYDSDVYKWVEAASKILASGPDEKLEKLLDDYTEILEKCQDQEGYVYTYNQFHFPGERWRNLFIEHELYTLGHLIEAGVSLYEYTGKERLLDIAKKCADLIVRDFSKAGNDRAPGHEEIELALIRLFRVTGEGSYLKMAEGFLERRGRISLFWLKLIRQFLSQNSRARIIHEQEKKQGISTDGALGFDFTENLQDEEPPFIGLRTNIQFLTGKYFQQHRPIRKQKVPAGHAVRWGYLATAAVLLYQENGDASLLNTFSKAWDRMVTRRMYVTGGIGSLPLVEGFGRDYELDNVFAYCETCAALAGIFLSWELLLATGDAKYADLMEWQLYNAASVGIALDGHSYLYRNPLESKGALDRKPWFGTACCPSNVSRTWAGLGKYIATESQAGIHIHQYISGDLSLLEQNGGTLGLSIESALPWDGNVAIDISIEKPVHTTLLLRIPGWAGKPVLVINGENHDYTEPDRVTRETASGYSPFDSWYLPVTRKWNDKDRIELTLPMAVREHRSHEKVKNNRGKVALSRGPLVYCLESIDNPEVPVPDAVLSSGHPVVPRFSEEHFKGACLLEGRDSMDRPLLFIPYYSWANREFSSMQVWTAKEQGK